VPPRAPGPTKRRRPLWIAPAASNTRPVRLPQMRMPAPRLFGSIIPTLELVGGVLVLLGLSTRWIGLLFITQFLVITFDVKLPRPAPGGGWDSARIDLMLLAAAVMLVLAGPEGGAQRVATQQASSNGPSLSRRA
jgi:uncharacterized membrane protein YphA (DoxX/SURF4 family)